MMFQREESLFAKDLLFLCFPLLRRGRCYIPVRQTHKHTPNTLRHMQTDRHRHRHRQTHARTHRHTHTNTRTHTHRPFSGANLVRKVSLSRNLHVRRDLEQINASRTDHLPFSGIMISALISRERGTLFRCAKHWSEITVQ